MKEQGRIERMIAGTSLALVALGCFAILWPFATSLLWAIIIAFSTWPLFIRTERALGGRKAAAAGVMTLLSAAVLVAPLALLVLTLADGATNLAALVRHWLEVGPPGPPSWVAGLPLIGTRLDERWQQVTTSSAAFTTALTPYLGEARNWVLGVSASLGGGIGKLLLSLVIALKIPQVIDCE